MIEFTIDIANGAKKIVSISTTVFSNLCMEDLQKTDNSVILKGFYNKELHCINRINVYFHGGNKTTI